MPSTKAGGHSARENGATEGSFGVGSSYLGVCEQPSAQEVGASQIVDGLRQVLDGHIDQAEVRYTCHAPDEKRWFKCVIRGTGSENNAIGALVMHFDITSEVLLEASTAAARKLAEQASHAKSSFLANMSHELRTPLNAIIGFSDLIASEAYGVHSSHKYAEYGRDISSAANHLLGMINNILDLSKIESGRLELSESLIDLGECTAEVFRFFEQEADQKRVRLRRDIPKRLPLVLADAGAIRQILINVIANALKFTGPGGTVSCDARLDRSTGDLVVEVSDDGVGIAKEDLLRISEPFAQVRSTLTSNNSGVGLGLSLVQGLARQHQATVDIQSEPGEGTQVILRLPRSRVRKRPAAKARPSRKQAETMAAK